MTESTRAHPPETTEGWYVLHQVLAWDRPALRALAPDKRTSLHEQAAAALEQIIKPSTEGWSAVVPLIGSRADVLLIHFRPTLDDIGVAQRTVNDIALFDVLRPVYTFLSVTEAGLYHASAELAKEALDRRGTPGDEIYRAEMAARVEKERANPHVHRRLFPTQPTDMPYVCFYPMSKRRAVDQNWYALSLEERHAPFPVVQANRAGDHLRHAARVTAAGEAMGQHEAAALLE